MTDEYIEIKEEKSKEPTLEELKDYAMWLGLDPKTDQDLFYIAQEALVTDLPPKWKIYQKKGEDNPFYFNTETGQSSWNHPFDSYFKELFQLRKEKKQEKLKLPKEEATYSNNKKQKDPNQLKLTTQSFLTVPFQNYEKDFTFIVNNKEYKTNKIIADILSPVICRIHLNDPTFNEYKIDTKEEGDFNNILNLIKFECIQIPIEEILFVIEVTEILQTKVKSTFYNRQNISIDNVLDLIKTHEKCFILYQDQLRDEIEFAASHFSQIIEEQNEELKSMSLTALELIISNENLILSSEDQLLEFINELYISNENFSILYEYVYFLNVTKKPMTEFLSNLQFDDLNKNIWYNISLLLKNNDSIDDQKTERIRFVNDYLFKGYDIKNGIISSLLKKSVKIEVNSSSTLDDMHSPQNLIIYNDNEKYFSSKNLENSWVSFNFINYSVIPLNYTLQSDFDNIIANPKDWVIEGSNDNVSWSIIDEQKNVICTNTKRYLRTFSIDNSKFIPFRYLRLRLTGKNWNGDNCLKVGSIEFYGKLVK